MLNQLMSLIERRQAKGWKVNHLVAIAGAAIAVTLSACKSTGISDEAEWTTTLVPMGKPVVQAGDTAYWLRDGSKEVTNSVVAVNGDMTTGKTSDGCHYTEITWGFSPSVEWSGCSPFANGQQEISSIEGSIWPLEVGKTVSYKFSGSNTAGETWNSTRRCEVESAVRITTMSGEHDTYKVVCKDSWTDRIWYVSPLLGWTVYFERFRRSEAERMKQELITVERAETAS